MDAIDAIKKRQSIRSFLPDPIPEDTVTQILEAAVQSPSPKNWQDWRFTVVTGNRKKPFIDMLLAAILEKNRAKIYTGSAINTIKAIAHAPLYILVFKPGLTPDMMQGLDPVLLEYADTLSHGALIQTMLIAARTFGIGSLWVGDVLAIEEQVKAWCNTPHKLVSLVALGYPKKETPKLERLPLNDIVTWIKE